MDPAIDPETVTPFGLSDIVKVTKRGHLKFDSINERYPITAVNSLQPYHPSNANGNEQHGGSSSSASPSATNADNSAP